MNRTLLIVAVALAILAGGYSIASATDSHIDYRVDGSPGTGYKPSGTCDGLACHSNIYTQTRFLPGSLGTSASNDFTAFCLGCHNATGEAHQKSAGSPSGNTYNSYTGLVPGNSGTSHNWNGQILNAGTRVPQTGFSGTANMPGGKVDCQTCHDAMSKGHEDNVDWAQATNPSNDHMNFVVSSGYPSTKQYLSQYLKVYRYGTALNRPTESRTKKNYLVNYTAYTYNNQTQTITFTTAQGATVNIYADIIQPYLRVGNTANAICIDCHNDRLDRSVSHEPGTGVKDNHPVMVPFGTRSGLHATLKGSADSNIFIEDGAVECTSCHDPHNATSNNGMLLRNADKSGLCTDCHKVNGYDGYTTAALAMHNGSKHASPTACADCHTTHATNNIMLIKNKINGVAVNFQNFSGPNNYVNSSGTGLCQVCHSATSHYTNDGLNRDHNVGRNCVECHGHNSGFQPVGGCTSCHGFPPAPGNAGPTGWSDTTGGLHVSHMTHLAGSPYNLTGTAACGACHPGKPAGTHPENLDTASVNLSAWGGTFNDGGTIGKTNTSDDTCDNVSCHGGGSRGWGGSGGCGGCHPFPGSGNEWAANNGHLVRGDGPSFAHMAATGYDANDPNEYAIVTADSTRCGKCHPNSPTHKYNTTIPLNATGYAACGGGNFTINQTTSRSDVTCDNVLCHSGRTSPNWW